jgi:hypothetical protein
MKLITRQFITVIALVYMLGQASYIDAQPTQQLTDLERIVESVKAIGWTVPTILLLYGFSESTMNTFQIGRNIFLNPNIPNNGTNTLLNAGARNMVQGIVCAYLVYYTSKWGNEALTKAYYGKKSVEETVQQ